MDLKGEDWVSFFSVLMDPFFEAERTKFGEEKLEVDVQSLQHEVANRLKGIQVAQSLQTCRFGVACASMSSSSSSSSSDSDSSSRSAAGPPADSCDESSDVASEQTDLFEGDHDVSSEDEGKRVDLFQDVVSAAQKTRPEEFLCVVDLQPLSLLIARPRTP